MKRTLFAAALLIAGSQFVNPPAVQPRPYFAKLEQPQAKLFPDARQRFQRLTGAQCIDALTLKETQIGFESGRECGAPCKDTHIATYQVSCSKGDHVAHYKRVDPQLGDNWGYEYDFRHGTNPEGLFLALEAPVAQGTFRYNRGNLLLSRDGVDLFEQTPMASMSQGVRRYIRPDVFRVDGAHRLLPASSDPDLVDVQLQANTQGLKETKHVRYVCVNNDKPCPYYESDYVRLDRAVTEQLQQILQQRAQETGKEGVYFIRQGAIVDSADNMTERVRNYEGVLLRTVPLGRPMQMNVDYAPKMMRFSAYDQKKVDSILRR